MKFNTIKDTQGTLEIYFSYNDHNNAKGNLLEACTIHLQKEIQLIPTVFSIHTSLLV